MKKEGKKVEKQAFSYRELTGGCQKGRVGGDG